MAAIEGFRYRVEDVLRGITTPEIDAARKEEIRTEILNSEKLKSYFEDHPHELELLEHDKPLLRKQIPTHLRSVPDYLLPASMKPKVQFQPYL